MFPNYREIEREFFQKTHIFPIMHVIVLRRDVHERHPWLANSLYRAFVLAKERALKRLQYPGSLVTMLPWQTNDMEEVDEVFGGDAFPYGIEPNRPTLEALIQHMVEQNFIAKPMPIESLFAPLPGAMGH